MERPSHVVGLDRLEVPVDRVRHHLAATMQYAEKKARDGPILIFACASSLAGDCHLALLSFAQASCPRAASAARSRDCAACAETRGL